MATIFDKGKFKEDRSCTGRATEGRQSSDRPYYRLALTDLQGGEPGSAVQSADAGPLSYSRGADRTGCAHQAGDITSTSVSVDEEAKGEGADRGGAHGGPI